MLKMKWDGKTLENVKVKWWTLLLHSAGRLHHGSLKTSVCVCDREFKDKSVSVCWSQTKGFCVQQIINITIILIFFFFKLKKKTHVTDPSNNAFQHHILKYVCCSVFNHSHSQCPDRSAWRLSPSLSIIDVGQVFSVHVPAWKHNSVNTVTC